MQITVKTIQNQIILLKKHMDYELFLETLKGMKMSPKEFSEISCTPLPTVRGWGARRKNKKGRKVPSWVRPFLNNYKELYELKIALKYMA